MKDYMKVKIAKKGCKFPVKNDKGRKNFVGIIKRRESFHPCLCLHLPMLQQILVNRVCIYEDLTLRLSCKP